MPFVAAWKNLETVIVNKVIQRKPNIYHLYVESKKKKMVPMSLSTKQKQIHSYRKQTYGYQMVKGVV